MDSVAVMPLQLKRLPATLPIEGAVRIELQEGVPVFKASNVVQSRIEALLAKQREEGLTVDEAQELEGYEEMDDYLSFVNRVTRNLIRARQNSGHPPKEDPILGQR